MFLVNHMNDGKASLDYNTNGFLNVYRLEIKFIPLRQCSVPPENLGKWERKARTRRAPPRILVVVALD
jgi:hypothetical protein